MAYKNQDANLALINHPYKKLLTATGIFIFSFLLLAVFVGIHLEENHRPLIAELSDIELDLSLTHFHLDSNLGRTLNAKQLKNTPTFYNINKRLKNLLQENGWDDVLLPIYTKQHIIQIRNIIKNIDAFNNFLVDKSVRKTNTQINIKLINLIDSVIELQNNLDDKFNTQIQFLHSLQFVVLGILLLYIMVVYKVINKYKKVKIALLLKQKDYLKLTKETNFFMQKSQRIAQLGYCRFKFNENQLEISNDFSKLLGLASPVVSYEQWLNLIIDEDKKILMDVVSKRRQDPDAILNIAYRIKRPKDGEIRWIHHFADTIALDSDYKPLPVFGILQDITEKRKLERDYINAFIEAQEYEKQSFGEELHDGISQILTAQKMYIDILFNQKEISETKKNEFLLKIKEHNLNAIQDTRRIAHGLMSKQLKQKGLLLALKSIFENYNNSKDTIFKFDYTDIREDEINKAIKTNLFRVTQELTTNILRHSGATEAKISIKKSVKNILVLVIEDNGVGIDFEKVSLENGGAGLKNVERRVTLLNGKLDLESTLNKGTKFTIIVPLDTSI